MALMWKMVVTRPTPTAIKSFVFDGRNYFQKSFRKIQNATIDFIGVSGHELKTTYKR